MGHPTCFQSVEEIGFEEADAVGEVVTGGIGGGDFEGRGGDVGCGDVGVGEVVGEGDGDGSGAGADVEDTEWCGGIEFGQDGFDEVFGFGAGDEDGGGDVEGERVELLFAGDVLDGFVDEAAANKGFVGGGLLGVEWEVGVGVVGGAGEAGGVEEKDERVAGSVGAEVGGRVELGSGAGEGGAEGGGSCQFSVLSSKCGNPRPKGSGRLGSAGRMAGPSTARYALRSG
jgi:hypothetical protein